MYNLNFIERNLSQFAEAPEKSQSKKQLNKQFKQTTLDKTLRVLSYSIQNQDTNVLKGLNTSLQKIIKVENEQFEKGKSALYKTNKLFKLFCSIFNINYPEKKLQKIHQEFLNLNNVVEKKIKDIEIDKVLKEYNINEENLEVAKQHFNDFINELLEKNDTTDTEEGMFDLKLAQFSKTKEFQELIQNEIEPLNDLSESIDSREQLTRLAKLFIDASIQFNQFSKQKMISAEDRLQLMILIILHLDNPIHFEKIKSEMTEGEETTDMRQTLGILEIAMTYMIERTQSRD